MDTFECQILFIIQTLFISFIELNLLRNLNFLNLNDHSFTNSVLFYKK
jgi:hypothetical protein